MGRNSRKRNRSKVTSNSQESDKKDATPLNKLRKTEEEMSEALTDVKMGIDELNCATLTTLNSEEFNGMAAQWVKETSLEFTDSKDKTGQFQDDHRLQYIDMTNRSASCFPMALRPPKQQEASSNHLIMNMGGTGPQYKKKRGKKSVATDCGRGDVFPSNKNSSSQSKGTDSKSAGMITSGGDNSSQQTEDSQLKSPEDLEANQNEEGKKGTDEAEESKTQETTCDIENSDGSMASVQKGEQCERNSTMEPPTDTIMTDGGCVVSKENESKFLGDGCEALMESENDDSKSVEIKEKNGEISKTIKETDQIDTKSDQADGTRHLNHDVNENISSQVNANLLNTEDSVDEIKGSDAIIQNDDIAVTEQESHQTGRTDNEPEKELTESIVVEMVTNKTANLQSDGVTVTVTEDKIATPEDSLTPTRNTTSESLLKEEREQGELDTTLTEESDSGCTIGEKPNTDKLPANQDSLAEEIRNLKSKSKSFNMEDQFIVQHQSLTSRSMSDGNIVTDQELLKQSGDVENQDKVSHSDGEVLRLTQEYSSEISTFGNINSSQLSKTLGQKSEETPVLSESESSSSKIEEPSEVIQHGRDEGVDTQPFLPTTEEEPLTKFEDGIETETTNSAVSKPTELEGMEDGEITDSQLCSLDWDNGTHTQSANIPTDDISEPARVVAPCPESSHTSELADGTKVVQGLIKELTALNQTLVKTKKEMEAARKTILK